MVSNSLTHRVLALRQGQRSLIRPMLIVCPSCATSYDLEPVSLPPQGRQVRCLRCRTVWHAEPNHADKLLAAAAALAPDAAAAADAARPVAADAVSSLIAHSAGFADAAAADVTQGSSPDQSADEPHDTERPAISGSPSEATGAIEVVEEASVESGDEFAQVEAPPVAPFDLDEGRPTIDIDNGDSNARHLEAIAHHVEPAEDIATGAARRWRARPRPALRWPLSRLQTGVLALIVVNGFIIGWRGEIVRALPQTASFYALIGLPVNLRGLAFDGVVTTTEQHEGVPILVVEGNIVNQTHKIADVPRLKFVVRNAARQEIYSWIAAPARSALPPGEAVAFHSRLASPPTDAHDLILRFVNRRDIIAAGR
jgi:predicted Zn finger-like uncharacterized protein